MTDIQNREQWLTEASELLLSDLLEPIVDDEYPLPKIRLSMSDSTKRKMLAWMHPTENSTTNQINEIFVAATADNPTDILGYILHELIHAYDNGISNHGGFFERVALEVGFCRPLPEYHPSEQLHDLLTEYAALLGPLPHQALKQKRQKQGNRHLKILCTAKSCGFRFSTSRRWLNLLNPEEAECPICYRVDTLREVTPD